VGARKIDTGVSSNYRFVITAFHSAVNVAITRRSNIEEHQRLGQCRGAAGDKVEPAADAFASAPTVTPRPAEPPIARLAVTKALASASVAPGSGS
jgi:hypothetical protein